MSPPTRRGPGSEPRDLDQTGSETDLASADDTAAEGLHPLTQRELEAKEHEVRRWKSELAAVLSGRKRVCDLPLPGSSW